jgi:oxygen-independent coproporphyrinogen-3 oxidase
MAEMVQNKLSAAGLSRYEISNYARRGWHSRHNVNYWRSGDYLGLGAGAHSYRAEVSNPRNGHRWSNEKNPGRYIAQATESRRAVVETETIESARAAGEFMFLGMRMMEGISVGKFTARFGKPPAEFYPKIRDWVDGGLLEERTGHLRLTSKGLLVANSIFVEFM